MKLSVATRESTPNSQWYRKQTGEKKLVSHGTQETCHPAIQFEVHASGMGVFHHPAKHCRHNDDQNRD
jgi:hypothetical protein